MERLNEIMEDLTEEAKTYDMFDYDASLLKKASRNYEIIEYLKELVKYKDQNAHGHWILVHPLQEDDPGALMCSNCKSGDWNITDNFKYCPFCGIPMDKSDNLKEDNCNDDMTNDNAINIIEKYILDIWMADGKSVRDVPNFMVALEKAVNALKKEVTK